MNHRMGNPFTSSRLLYPADQQPDYEHYCQTDNPSPIDISPFPRRVDMWFASLSMAARNGLNPVDLSGRRTIGFTEGRIFDPDPWRIRALILLALAIDKSIDVVDDTGKIMAIANGLAAAGEPLIVEMLGGGHDREIWNLSESLEALLSSD